MAEPKKRTNSSKQGMRRMHDKISAPVLDDCTNCHEPKLSHAVCPSCGYYKNEKILKVKSDKVEKEDKEDKVDKEK